MPHCSTACLLGGFAAFMLAGSAIAQDSFGQAQSGGGGFGQPHAGGQVQPGYPGPQTGVGGQQPGYQQPQNPGVQPQQPGFQQPGPAGQQPGYAPQPPQSAGIDPQFLQYLDQLAQYERQDLGVPATQQLHSGAMHGATPASIPGGQIITTRGLVELIQGQQMPFVIFDVLGSNEVLPGAMPAVQASYPGSFNDQISQQMGAYIQQITQGNAQIPLIFYCASRDCWMSYNAALRAINLGYQNVLWYRGGIEAWKQAGGPTMPPGGYGAQTGQYGGQQQPDSPQQPGYNTQPGFQQQPGYPQPPGGGYPQQGVAGGGGSAWQN